MTLRLNGSTSGFTEIDAPAVAGSNTLVLPTGAGSANQFLKNGSTAGSLGWSSLVEDSSGRLLVGTSSTSGVAKLVVKGNTSSDTGVIDAATNLSAGGSIVASTEIGILRFTDANANRFAHILCEADAASGTNDHPGRLLFSTTADGAASPTERMRISNNGTVAINSSNSTYFLEVTGSSTLGGLRVQAPGSGGNYPVLFRDSDATSGTQQLVRIERGGSQVGYIATTNTSTSYATSSDYRLKENVEPIAGAIARILQLKPSRFNFIVDPGCTVDGFIAHETQAVVPEAISGTKDEMDADGNPVYQGIDQSKLVPLLTAALQEAIAKIESLEARLTALEVTP